MAWLDNPELGWECVLALSDLPASRQLFPLGEAEFMSGLLLACPCPVCRSDGIAGRFFTPSLSIARVLGESVGCNGVSRALRTPKPEVQDWEARPGAGGVGMFSQ